MNLQTLVDDTVTAVHWLRLHWRLAGWFRSEISAGVEHAWTCGVRCVAGSRGIRCRHRLALARFSSAASSLVTRQPGNQATRQLGLCPPIPEPGATKGRRHPRQVAPRCLQATDARFIYPGRQGRGLTGPTLRIAFDLDCTRGFPVPPRRRRAFHDQLSSIPVARDAASLARRFESPSTSTARADFQFHLGGDAHSTINFHPSRSPGTRPRWPDASNRRRPRLHAQIFSSTSAATCIPLSTFIHPGRQGRGLTGPTPRIAFDLDSTRGFSVSPRRRRLFHSQPATAKPTADPYPYPDSRFPIPDSRFPLPTPHSPLPTAELP